MEEERLEAGKKDPTKLTMAEQLELKKQEKALQVEIGAKKIASEQ